MKRRELLAVGTAVTLPGCSERALLEGDAEQAEPEGETAAETDENGDDGTDPEGDGETEREDEARAAVDRDLETAAAALETAIRELEGQTERPLGAIDARSAAVSSDPIDEHLSGVRDAIARGRDREPGGDHEAALDALATLEATVRALVASLESTAALPERVDAAFDALADGSFDDAADAADDLVDASEAAADDLAAAAENADGLDDPDALEALDAVDPAALSDQLGALEADVAAARGVADAVEPLTAAEELFWPAYDRLVDEAFDDADDEDFFDAAGEYAAAAGAVSSSPAFETDAAVVRSYARTMLDASTAAARLVNQHANEFYVGAHDAAADLRTRLSTAADVGLRSLEADDLELEYDMREYSDPVLEFAAYTWTEDGTLVVDGDVTNPTPYDIEASVGPVPYDEDGSLGLEYTKRVDATIEAGETWQPDRYWRFDGTEYVDVGLDAAPVEWAESD